MTARLAHAAREARYVMMVSYQYSSLTREAMMKKCCDELTEALMEYDVANPGLVRCGRDREKFDAGLGSYMDTVEEFSQ